MIRRTVPSAISTALVAASLITLSSRAAHAYIDPGTGSYVLQVVVASLLAAAFVVKSTWQSLRQGFVRLFVKRPKDAE